MASAGAAAMASTASIDADVVASLPRKYTSHALRQRLELLAKTSESQRVKAASALMDIIRKSTAPDTTLFRSMLSVTGSSDSSALAWADSCDRAAAVRLSELERALNLARAHQIRDDTFAGYTDLAAFHVDRGALEGAMACVLAARDYCASSKQTTECNLTLATLSAVAGEAYAIGAYISRVESTTEMLNSAVANKVRLLRGLLSLSQENYEGSAREFLGVAPSALDGPVDLLHPDDAGLIGGLCALATYSRDELKSSVLNAPSCKLLLEAYPQVRQAIQAFVSSQYAAMRKHVDSVRRRLELDPFAAKHTEHICSLILHKAMAQYLVPYATVKLDAMGSAFELSTDALQMELSQLISSGRVSARIDLVAKTLVAHKSEPRAVAFDHVLATARHMESEARVLLLRASCQEHGIFVRSDHAGSSSAVFAPSEPGDIMPTFGVAGQLPNVPLAEALLASSGEQPMVE